MLRAISLLSCFYLAALVLQGCTIARSDVRVPASSDYEQRLAEKVEKSKSKALDARYAGAADAITMYVMVRRN